MTSAGEADAPRGEVIVYQAPDGDVRVDVRLERETVWRSLEMVECFDLDAALAYTRLLRSARTAASVGFFLVQGAGNLIAGLITGLVAGSPMFHLMVRGIVELAGGLLLYRHASSHRRPYDAA